MSQSVPVTLTEWREFLLGYSADLLRLTPEVARARYSDLQRENQWLGHEPADEEAVRAAEERIGLRLPQSYRNFLLTSNGWRHIDPLLYEVLNVDEIDLLPTAAPELWDMWSDGEDAEQLEGCVLLSGHADGDYWLLDPHSVGPDGEWTAYVWLASSGCEPEPYPSFAALVADARARSARHLERRSHPVHPDRS